MLFTWLKRRRRQRLWARPFPESWQEVIERNVSEFRRLGLAEQQKVRRDLVVFVHEKNWEGCQGLDMTDEVRVTISAQMALLVLGFPAEYFDAVQSILVYPDAYVAPERTVMESGLVLEGHAAREGEAWYRGPVILSWSDVLASGQGRTPGRNLVFHEFAHQLDMQNGHHTDGTPPLASREAYRQWSHVIPRHYQELVRTCSSGGSPLLDCYGATNLAEFFAVATETFLCRPRQLQSRHPELYAVLSDYYRQDPSARITD